MLLIFTACKEEPKISVAQTYEENFTLHFGEIDPAQDWNLAERNSIKLMLGERHISSIQILAPINNRIFRITSAHEMEGTIVLPFDMPKGLDYLVADLDGRQFIVKPGATLNPLTDTPISQSAMIPIDDSVTDLKWLMVAEDLGDTDDFDFNDFILQISVPRPHPIKLNAETQEWEEVDDSYVLTHTRADGSRTWDPEGFTNDDLLNHSVVVTALAAGGVLKIWLHYYDDTTDTDWVIGPDNTAEYSLGYIKTSELDQNPTLANNYEWHRWITLRHGLPYTTDIMFNTGWESPEPLDITNPGNGITIALPINDNSYYSQGQTTVIAPNFCIEEYSVTEEEFSAGSDHTYRFKIRKGFYFTVGQYKVQSSGYGHYVELGNAIGHPTLGSAPQVFLIPDQGFGDSAYGWLWPKERANISEAYPDFKEWCRNGNYTNWYLTRYKYDLLYHNRYIPD